VADERKRQVDRREHWVLHDKLIIGLDDEDMRQLLLTKLAETSRPK